MDGHSFDRLTRILATAATRRVLTGMLAGSTLSALLGWSAEDAAGKKRKRKKKKKPSNCTCFNKVCGADDDCGGKCTVQDGCPADAACIAGECVPGICSCGGTNKVCHPDGSCRCPQGHKECQSGGYPGYCHECCIDGSGVFADQECFGSARGPWCIEDDGDLVNTCGCRSGLMPCGGGVCGHCCDTFDCFFDVFDEGQIVDSGRDCLVADEASGLLSCQCRQGYSRCGTTSVCAAPDDDRLCGPTCMDCTRFAGHVCQGDRCCVPSFGNCLTSGDCCTGLTCVQQTVEPFEFVCA